MSGPSTASPSSAADWFELACLSQQAPILRRSTMERVTSFASPDLSTERVEELVSDVIAEVKRRAARAGDLYPFTAGLRGLQRRAISNEAQLMYAFLVLCSLVPSFRRNDSGFQPGKLFERIAANALASFTSGEAVVFADIQKTGVRSRIKDLGRLLNVRTYEENARPSRKDHGLDVASWRGFGDQRGAHPIVLCQCTLMSKHSDLIIKAREVANGEWGRLLDVREGTLSSALAIPHVLEPGYEHWDELRSNTDLIIERVRLLHLLSSTTDPWSPLLADKARVQAALERWTSRELASVS